MTSFCNPERAIAVVVVESQRSNMELEDRLHLPPELIRHPHLPTPRVTKR